jgi:hypothetical protein
VSDGGRCEAAIIALHDRVDRIHELLEQALARAEAEAARADAAERQLRNVMALAPYARSGRLIPLPVHLTVVKPGKVPTTCSVTALRLTDRKADRKERTP